MRFVDVLLLDIDGTMVGDVHYQVCQYDVSNAITQHSQIKMNVIDYQHQLQLALKEGLLHPDLKMFLNNHKKSFRYFVYTASERDWAITLVSCIEKVLGIRFKRPLFTRNDCFGDDLTKNIDSVRERVKATIENGRQNVRVRNIFLIDNNKTLNRQKKMLIHCPSYDRRVLVNVFRNLKDQLRRFWDHVIPNSASHNTLGETIVNLLVTTYEILPKTAKTSIEKISYARFMALYEKRFKILKRQRFAKNATSNLCWSIMDSQFKNKCELSISDVKIVNSSLDLTRK